MLYSTSDLRFSVAGQTFTAGSGIQWQLALNSGHPTGTVCAVVGPKINETRMTKEPPSIVSPKIIEDSICFGNYFTCNHLQNMSLAPEPFLHRLYL